MRYPMVSPNIATEKQENDNNLNKPMDLGVPYLQTNPEQKTMRVFVDVLHAWISYEAWPIMGGSKILKIENVQRNNPGKPMVWGTPNSRNTQLNWNQASGKLQILQAPPGFCRLSWKRRSIHLCSEDFDLLIKNLWNQRVMKMMAMMAMIFQ